jgi:membrane associated rhomboid family serine protease
MLVRSAVPRAAPRARFVAPRRVGAGRGFAHSDSSVPRQHVRPFADRPSTALPPLAPRRRANRIAETDPSSPAPAPDADAPRLAARAGKGAGFGLPSDADDLVRKYGDAAKATGQYIGKASGMQPPTRGRARDDGNGVFLLLLLNVALFVADQVMHVPVMKDLYLNHMNPRWWQFVTSIFCHANWAHLSGNIFFLYVFGKIVEEEEGAFGVWFSYLFTGVGAGLASYLMLPRGSGGVLGVGASATVSLGASGAVFGLFAISVLTKLTRPSLRKLLEAVILGQFVVERFLSEAKMAAAVGGVGAGGVNHVAHLAGALAGVALIWMLSRMLPADGA